MQFATRLAGVSAQFQQASKRQLRRNEQPLLRAVLEVLEDRRLLSGAAPVAVNDAFNSDEDVQLAGNVLTNDTDAESDPLTAVLDTNAANGSVVLNTDGSFTYTPNGNFNGADSFTYHANDGTSDSNIATVNITIAAVNDAPVTVADAYSTPEDTPLSVPAPGVLSNDTDAEGNALTAVLVDGPTNGTLTLNPDGSLLYTPAANFNGSDSFTYRANDGTADGNIATVSITVTSVNDAPPVSVDDSYTTNEDVTLNVAAPGVLANDTDVDGDSLTAVLVTGPSDGALTLNPDGSFSYTPAPNFNGSDSFTYRANDGTADGNIATVTITVTAQNDAPVATNDSYSTAEDTPLTVAAPGVLGNDTDAEGDAMTAVLDTGPTHGTLTLNPDGSFTYTPDANYNGPDSFTYRANDGTTDGNIATVSITVTSVNDAPPVSVDDSYTTDEDATLNVPAPGVLANDTDVDGDALTAVLVTGPTRGDLTLNPDGSFTYIPDADLNGSDSFTYRANDGTENGNLATVNITVTAVSDAHVGVDDRYTTPVDTQLDVPAPGVLGNDTDAEGDPLTAVLVSGPSDGSLTLNPDGSFTYTPDAAFHGLDGFIYRASDGGAQSDETRVTISVNSYPIVVNDSYSVDEDDSLVVAAPGVLGNDTDADGDSMTAFVVTGPANGSLFFNANGSFTYTPNANFSGSDSFTYQATDGFDNSFVATVNITVNPNQQPTASDFTVLRNPGSSANIDVLGHASDDDDDSLAISLGQPNFGRVFVNNRGTPRNFDDDFVVYIPNHRFFGADSFTYTVDDGNGGTRTARVTVTVAQIGTSPNPRHPGRHDLYVLGTNDDDDIILENAGANNVRVVFNGVNEGVFRTRGRVIVYGNGGDDILDATNLNRPVQLFGGEGVDRLIASARPSLLFGGPGRDVLIRNSPRDILRKNGNERML